MSGAALFTYGNHTLYTSDLALVQPGQWLNDRIIGFYYEYLENSQRTASKAVLLNPDTAMMLLFLDTNELEDVLAPLALRKAELVFVPVNNNADATQAGGTHWSLLVHSANNKSFHAFDSAHGMNLHVARKLAAALTPLLSTPSAPCSREVEAMSMPAQTNSDDCGVYVLAATEYILQHGVYADAKSALTQEAIAHKRIALSELMSSLAQDTGHN